METIDFLKKLKKRDEHVFSMIIDTYSRLLWTVVGKYLSKSSGYSPEDVEECVSDVFFELWEHPERYDPQKGSIKTYLCTVAKNKAISQFRKKAQSKTVYFEDYMQHEELSAEETIDTSDYKTLYAAISALPEPTREILIRRYFHEEKPAIIADKMALSKKEVENRLYRGKRSLLNSLSNLREVR